MISFLHLQECLACLVRLIWMVLEMENKKPYRCCFLRCCFQDLSSIARSILVQFLSSFFSISFFRVYVVYPYSCIDTTAARKKCVLFKKKLDGNYKRMLRAILNKSPTVRPPITKTIQVRRTRHAGHCWRSRDELISDVL